MKRHYPPSQIVASRPYDGFWFTPVIHAERSRQEVQQEELPSLLRATPFATPLKQRGLL